MFSLELVCFGIINSLYLTTTAKSATGRKNIDRRTPGFNILKEYCIKKLDISRDIIFSFDSQTISKDQDTYYIHTTITSSVKNRSTLSDIVMLALQNKTINLRLGYRSLHRLVAHRLSEDSVTVVVFRRSCKGQIQRSLLYCKRRVGRFHVHYRNENLLGQPFV